MTGQTARDAAPATPGTPPGDAPMGLIEGFYGRPWTWSERSETIAFLARHGYHFYIYAPKADAFLRRRWREPHPEAELENLRRLAGHCRSIGVRFGVGLSPFEIYRDFNDDARNALTRKLADLDGVGVDDLAILFDDMRGDLPGLANAQVRIAEWIAQRTSADRIVICPTYYTDDPLLDRAFGTRPDRYLEALGRRLDPAVGVFWTGVEVCSKAFETSPLERVTEKLGRKPWIWDNYPVNDGPVMSLYLHLRGVTGRPGAMAARIAAHAVNPASQAVLSRIPALTLARSYAEGEAYDYGAAFDAAAEAVLGADLAQIVRRHLTWFQDHGLDRLGEAGPRLRERYAPIDHPGAREIVAWLDGAWRVTRETMEAS